MMLADLPIAVVGAGFSGTTTALHLLAKTRAQTILLCERGERFARGTAFGTDDPGHLLNVRATNMSAFPDQPDHFVRWLDACGLAEAPQVHSTPAGIFVSRRLYGAYLTSLLSEAVTAGDGASRLILVPDEVIDLVPDRDGAFDLVLAGGRRHRVAGAVLAVGHGLQAENDASPYVSNPWAGDFCRGLDPHEPVVVVGSGLTMVDVALHLRRAGLKGPIIAISRRGLLSHAHGPSPAWPVPDLTDAERRSPARLLRRMRREAATAQASGVGWRSVVDSLRPITAALWQGFDRDAQRRFLRHARPWWDIHRHRMAIPVGAVIEQLVRDGDLDVRAGRIEGIATAGPRAQVTYRPRCGTESRVIDAQLVVNATGGVAPDKCGSALVDQLIGRGLARLDHHRLGLDLTERFAVVSKDGTVTPGLWALGPLGLGVFWESTAVPDIRQQAVRVADEVAAGLATQA